MIPFRIFASCDKHGITWWCENGEDNKEGMNEYVNLKQLRDMVEGMKKTEYVVDVSPVIRMKRDYNQFATDLLEKINKQGIEG